MSEGGWIYSHSPRNSCMTVSKNHPIDASLCRMVVEWLNESFEQFFQHLHLKFHPFKLTNFPIIPTGFSRGGAIAPVAPQPRHPCGCHVNNYSACHVRLNRTKLGYVQWATSILICLHQKPTLVNTFPVLDHTLWIYKIRLHTVFIIKRPRGLL